MIYEKTTYIENFLLRLFYHKSVYKFVFKFQIKKEKSVHRADTVLREH